MVLDKVVAVLSESDRHLYCAFHDETRAQVLKRQQSVYMQVEVMQDRAQWRRRVLLIAVAWSVRKSWGDSVVDVLGGQPGWMRMWLVLEWQTSIASAIEMAVGSSWLIAVVVVMVMLLYATVTLILVVVVGCVVLSDCLLVTTV